MRSSADERHFVEYKRNSNKTERGIYLIPDNKKKKNRSSDLFLDLEITSFDDAHLKAIIYCTFLKAFSLVDDLIEETLAAAVDPKDVVNAVSVFCQVNKEFSSAAEKRCLQACKHYEEETKATTKKAE